MFVVHEISFIHSLTDSFVHSLNNNLLISGCVPGAVLASDHSSLCGSTRDAPNIDFG